MKIGEAIKILTSDVKGSFKHSFTQVKEAEQLGIEALIAWRQHRRRRAPANLYLLPGETEE